MPGIIFVLQNFNLTQDKLYGTAIYRHKISPATPQLINAAPSRA